MGETEPELVSSFTLLHPSDMKHQTSLTRRTHTLFYYQLYGYSLFSSSLDMLRVEVIIGKGETGSRS